MKQTQGERERERRKETQTLLTSVSHASLVQDLISFLLLFSCLGFREDRDNFDCCHSLDSSLPDSSVTHCLLLTAAILSFSFCRTGIRSISRRITLMGINDEIHEIETCDKEEPFLRKKPL